MKIDISQIREMKNASIDISVVEPVAPLEIGGEEVAFDGPVSSHLSFRNAGNFISVEGSVSARALLTCNRCLKRLTVPLSGAIEARYYLPGAGGGHLKERDEDIKVLQGAEIDLTADVREALILSLPVKVLCSEACKGLCPVCGKDLNEGDCGCQVEDGDVRLAVLKDLLKEQRS